jgi:hydrogenase maturation protease
MGEAMSVDGPEARLLVLGIGNVLLRDDGVGIRVLRALEREFESDARLRFVDGGTIGFMLAAIIERTPELLVIDAARMTEAPGSVRCFEDSAMDRFLRGRSSSVHEIGLRDLLDMARLTGSSPRRRALIGVEPAAIEIGDGLSSEVEQGATVAVRMAGALIRSWLDDSAR